MLFLLQKTPEKIFVVTIDITTKRVYNIVVIKKVTTNRFTFSIFKLFKTKTFQHNFQEV